MAGETAIVAMGRKPRDPAAVAAEELCRSSGSAEGCKEGPIEASSDRRMVTRRQRSPRRMKAQAIETRVGWVRSADSLMPQLHRYSPYFPSGPSLCHSPSTHPDSHFSSGLNAKQPSWPFSVFSALPQDIGGNRYSPRPWSNPPTSNTKHTVCIDRCHALQSLLRQLSACPGCASHQMLVSCLLCRSPTVFLEACTAWQGCLTDPRATRHATGRDHHCCFPSSCTRLRVLPPAPASIAHALFAHAHSAPGRVPSNYSWDLFTDQ